MAATIGTIVRFYAKRNILYNEIIFYGDINNLTAKLFYHNIKMTINKDINECSIVLIK